MALLAALLTPLAFAAAQQTGDPPFTCALPQGYSAFAPVSGRSEAWESKTEAGDARFLVERFLLDGYGAHADSVLRDLKQRAWGTTALEAEEISFTAWSGQWGGVPEIAGHTVNYKKEGKQPGAVVERVAVVGEQMIHFLWDGPATRIAEGLDTADRFRIPDVWIPAPALDRDLHRGLAPGSEALALPWALEIRLDFVSRRDQGDLDVAVRAKPVAEGGRIPARAEWNLPPGAIDLGTDEEGFIRYRLSASADPNQPLFAWSLLYSPQGDLAAFDPIWLALPAEPPGRWLPPSWSLEARHPGHVELLGPTEWMHKHELAEQGALTQIGPVPAGLCWPFFVSGRFQKRQQSGTTWYLRLDAKAIVPDEAVAALHRLVKAADAWLGVPGDGAWTVVSFPRAGDRVLPGLFVLDEEQEWFAKPADGRLGTLSRRIWLARLVASSRFGSRLRGSGNAAPMLESALAEWSAARLLDAAGFTEEAKELRDAWDSAELKAGALPTPLSLLPAEEIFARGRLLSAGARFWSALETLAGRSALDEALRAFYAAGRPWTTRQLESALAGDASDRAEKLRAFFDACLYGTKKP